MPTWILVFALLLRLPLMTSSLWLDEAIQALALQGRYGPILEYALGDFQPPLYHFLLAIWTKLAGFSEFALRTPSLLAGLGTVYFGYLLGKQLKDTKVAQIAALLLATNPLLIYYSAEGRTYMLTCFFVTGSFYFLLKLLRAKHAAPLLSTFYFLLSTFALWTSYLAWLAVLLQFAYLLAKRKFGLARLSFFAGLTLVMWLPSLLSSLGIGLSTVADSPAWGRVVGGLSVKAVALTWVKIVLGRISFSPPALYLAIVGLVLGLHAYLLSRLKSLPPLLGTWLGTVVLAVLVASFVPVYSYFRLLFVVPAYLLLLALALARLPRFLSALTLALQLLFTGILLCSPQFQHEDWRALTSYLNKQTGGVVAMPSLSQSAPLEYYQLELPLTELKTGQQVSESHVYYLRYVEDLFDPGQLGRANLKSLGYTKINEQVWPGLALEIYAK